MRDCTSVSSPKISSVDDESTSNIGDKSSAKKLRQARLPFKVIAPSTPPVDARATATPVIAGGDKDVIKEISTDDRKRKLSYDTDDDGANVEAKEGDKVSKENVKKLKTSNKKKKLSAVSNNDAYEVISLLDDEDKNADEGSNEDVENSSSSVSVKPELNSKTLHATTKDKRKGAGTPQTSYTQKNKNGSATKLQIKLPLSGGKKKRRKSNHSQLPVESSAADLSNDDAEEIGIGLNPHKRKRCISSQEQTTEVITLDSDPEKVNDVQAIDKKSTKPSSGNNDSETESEKQNGKVKKVVPDKFSGNSQDGLLGNSIKSVTKTIEISESSDDNEKQKDDKEDLEESVISDNEADDETDNVAGKSAKASSDVSERSNLKQSNSMQLIKNENNSGTSSKNLTPKQIKLMEQRRKAREEKERKLQEEKTKKQQEKEEKELLKKREREEKEEQKRKEREEKEEQKRKEREEKERKRLAEIEAKNEEKRKKNEAREEELRKKEEERKRREMEKEEAELKKKKAAQAFTKFFVAKLPTSSQVKNEEDSNTGDSAKLLAFRPFQIKGDMKLAPICRRNFTEDEKNYLDDLLNYSKEKNLTKNDLENESVRSEPQSYLSELRSGKILPGKWRQSSIDSKDDVILVEDELERVGQEIVEDIPAYVREEMRVKYYKFHDNRRPPYYGTWRKKSSVVSARKPFAQDMKFFDYGVDSDDEWEEEEPGESLEDGSDEDKEKESEDDDYEVDNEWFVPHGHLSDEELQNEDEFGMGDDNTREAQKVKLQLLQQEFAQEMKKKTEKIKPRLIGCIWADINGSQPPECAKILWDTLEKKAMIFVDSPSIEEAEVDKPTDPSSPSNSTSNTERVTEKIKPITLSDEMVKDLTRLIHGNSHSKNFLINEYLAYVEKTEESVKNGELRKPLKSVVRDKIDEIAEWQAIDATATNIQEVEQANDETNDKKKKKIKRRLCWVVKLDMLNKLNLSSLELNNSWQYTLKPKFVKPNKELKTDEAALTLNTPANSTPVECNEKTTLEASKKSNIVKDATAEEKTIESQNKMSAKPIPANTPTRSKEKKRVPLLMSVARGQQISTPTKNKLISQFLHTTNKDNVKPSSPTTPTRTSNAVGSPNVVVILD